MMEASPRALAVAPFAYTTVISSYAKKGILLKGGQVLDALASCHTNAFDKSGRLTTGVVKEALALATAMEKSTAHLIGRGLVATRNDTQVANFNSPCHGYS
ncbi:unnamed protein product [Linum trigynum]|uniref:Uncharacterized protein n=1 Tax=Linum trigynum TaxID=586398 RepID=A0AAV2E4I4_9ROSI